MLWCTNRWVFQNSLRKDSSAMVMNSWTMYVINERYVETIENEINYGAKNQVIAFWRKAREK